MRATTRALLFAVLAAVVLTLWLRERPDPRPREVLDLAASDLADAPDVVNRSAPPPERSPLWPPAIGTDPEAGDPAQAGNASAPEGRRVVLLVTDTEGAPIGGATVRSTIAGSPLVLATDEHGQVTLPLSPMPGRKIRLEVEHPGFMHRHADFARLPWLEIRLGRAVTLTGRVLDAEHRTPVAGATLTRAHSSCVGCEPDVVSAGADGTYSLEDVPVGVQSRFSVDARGVDARGYLPAFSRFVLAIEGESAEHDFLLERGFPVTGRVVDLVSGAPLAGAQVRGPVGKGVTAGASGDFELVVTGGDGAEFRADAAGHCARRYAFAAEELLEPLLLELLPSVCVEGVVLDAAGAPVAAARVKPEYTQRPDRRLPASEIPAAFREDLPYSSPPRTTTDAEGRFRLCGLAPWRNFDLHVTARGYLRERVILDPIRDLDGRTGVEIRLEKGNARATLAGRVTLNGEPADAFVRWTADETHHGGVRALDGRYRLPGVAPGPVRVEVSLRRGEAFDAAVAGRSVELEAVAGRTVEHDFELSAALAPISGRVVREGGGAIGVETISASDQGGQFAFHAVVRADGSFELPALETDAPYDLSVRDAGETITKTGVPAGSNGVEILVPALGRLRVRAVDAQTSDLVSDFRAQRLPRAGSRSNGELEIPPDQEGWVTYRMPPGTYDVLFSAESYAPTIVRSVVVQPREQSSVEGVLQRGIDGCFVLADGGVPPARNEYVFLLDDAAWESFTRHKELDPRSWDGGELFPGRNVFDRALRFKEGTATLRGLSAGTYRFHAFPDVFSIQPEVVVIAAGQTELEVALRVSRKE